MAIHLVKKGEYMVGAIINFWNANESWRFAAFAIILLGGIFSFEFLFRFVKNRFKIYIQSKGYSSDNWNLSIFKPSFRLAFIALIMRLSEPFFIFSHQHHTIFRIIEFFFLTLAIILVFFEGISLLDMTL